MGALEPPHLIVILVIVLIIFGPGKLPQLGKALGEGIRELRHAADEAPAPPRPSAAVASASATRSCPQCQAAVPATQRFCGACGAAQPSGAL